jgi:hypothetical protein
VLSRDDINSLVAGGGDEQRRERAGMRDRAAEEPSPEMGCMALKGSGWVSGRASSALVGVLALD